jgi:hypothetical protein
VWGGWRGSRFDRGFCGLDLRQQDIADVVPVRDQGQRGVRIWFAALRSGVARFRLDQARLISSSGSPQEGSRGSLTVPLSLRAVSRPFRYDSIALSWPPPRSGGMFQRMGPRTQTKRGFSGSEALRGATRAATEETSEITISPSPRHLRRLARFVHRREALGEADSVTGTVLFRRMPFLPPTRNSLSARNPHGKRRTREPKDFS